MAQELLSHLPRNNLPGGGNIGAGQSRGFPGRPKADVSRFPAKTESRLCDSRSKSAYSPMARRCLQLCPRFSKDASGVRDLTRMIRSLNFQHAPEQLRSRHWLWKLQRNARDVSAGIAFDTDSGKTDLLLKSLTYLCIRQESISLR